MAPSDSDDGAARLLETSALLARAKAGEAAAREGLFLRYRHPLERFLHGRLPPSARSFLDTEDAVQEVSRRALAALPRFEYRGTGSFWSFLRAIARRYADEVYRRQSRRGPDAVLQDDSSEAPPSGEATPSAEAAAREEYRAFETALAGIPGREREALLMRLELGLDYASIATPCGYPSPDAARMAIRRAMVRVARAMSRGSLGT
ncbi:MAG: sigma-70 family RNA polymerase sigma factor [Planctomycetes bacterium]|nr:sigma-70 family RNA polymerase sigma factor [Planctomycetota bacterium]